MTLLVAAGPSPRIVKRLTTLQRNLCLGSLFFVTRPEPTFSFKLHKQTQAHKLTQTQTNIHIQTNTDTSRHTHTSTLTFTQTDIHTQTHPDTPRHTHTRPAGTINYFLLFGGGYQ